MTKWTSMSVKDTTLERMDEHQPEDHDTRDKFLNVLLDTWENEGSNASQCEGDISETLEALRRDVDDLQHRLPKEIAEELRG